MKRGNLFRCKICKEPKIDEHMLYSKMHFNEHMLDAFQLCNIYVNCQRQSKGFLDFNCVQSCIYESQRLNKLVAIVALTNKFFFAIPYLIIKVCAVLLFDKKIYIFTTLFIEYIFCFSFKSFPFIICHVFFLCTFGFFM